MSVKDNHNHKPDHAGDGQPSPAPLGKRMVRFLVAVFLVGGFIYLAPNLERLPGGIGHTITVLRESGIDVGAWYWDDVEQCTEGEGYIREMREIGRRR